MKTNYLAAFNRPMKWRKGCITFLVVILFASFREKELTWVAIGDSITYLNDHPDETGNRDTKGYMTRVTEKLPYLRYINQGHNGWTSGDIAKAVETLGLEKADLYTVFLGTNDWWRGRPLGAFSDYQNATGNETVFGSFRIIVNKLRRLNPEAKIILVTPMQRADFVYINDAKNNAYGSYREKNGQRLDQFANAIRMIGEFEGFEVLDLYHKNGMDVKHMVKFKWLKDPNTGVYKKFSYPGYVDVPFRPGTDDYPYPPEAIDITYDGLHPSDKGYELISQELVKVIKSLHIH